MKDINDDKLGKYYDEVDSEEEFDFSKAKYHPAKTKLINIIIPLTTYNLAKEIGEKSGTGYQNTLKLAMTIGLEKIKKQIP